jgi:hypothetical protein
VLRAQLPWLSLDCAVKKNAHTARIAAATAAASAAAGKGFRKGGAEALHETRGTLPAALTAVILELNRDDLALYDHARRLLDEDYRKIRRPKERAI